jgi:hypothetical protein
MSISKKNKINKKNSKKKNKNIQYGGWNDLFLNPDLTLQQVKELIITKENGKFTIRRARYEGICDRLLEYRQILKNRERMHHWSENRRYIFNFLKNINKILFDFGNYQLNTHNIDTYYFHLEDGKLYTVPLTYSDAENPYADLPIDENEDEDYGIRASLASTASEVGVIQQQRKLLLENNRVRRHDKINIMMNNFVILSIFTCNVLFENFVEDIRNYNQHINFLRNQLQQQQQAEDQDQQAQQQTQHEIDTHRAQLQDINQQYFAFIQDIIQNFLNMFTRSLVKILDSSSVHDISYIKFLHEDVIQIYRLLIQLPRCPEVNTILHEVSLRIFLKKDIKGRFSFLNILSGEALQNLEESDIYTYQFRCSDLIKLTDPAANIPALEQNDKDLCFINILCNTIDKMKHSRIIRPLPNGRQWWDLLSYEFTDTMQRLNDVSIQFHIEEPYIHYILKQLSNIINILLQNTNIDNTEIINNILFFLKVVIYHNPYILNTFSVLLIIDIVTPLIDSQYTDMSFKNVLGSIIALCYSSKYFRNYFALSMVEDPFQKYSFLTVLYNGELIHSQLCIDYRNLRKLESLSEIADKFMDPIGASVIQNLGIYPEQQIASIDFTANIPVDRQELDGLYVIDVFVWKKIALMSGKNPFTRENMSIDDIDRIQAHYRGQIELLKVEKQNIIRAASVLPSVYPPRQ